MVAAINSLAGPIHSSGEDKAAVGPLRECLGKTYEKAALAPTLHSVILECLHCRGLSKIQVAEHLKILKCSKRYQTAFSVLYAMGFCDEWTMQSSADLFGGLLLELNGYSMSTTKNAYAALMLSQGFKPSSLTHLWRVCASFGRNVFPNMRLYWTVWLYFVTFSILRTTSLS